MNPIFFNAHHAPIGAFASFTLGAKGACGGLGLELGRPADQEVFIGLEDKAGSHFFCLPFFGKATDKTTDFNIGEANVDRMAKLSFFADAQITRAFTPGRDGWQAGDLTFQIHTPVMSAPDPRARASLLKLAYVPAITAEITVDNRRGNRARRALFGFKGNDPWRGMRRLDETSRGRFCGITSGPSLGIATDSPGVVSALGFSAEQILSEPHPANYEFGLGDVGLCLMTIPVRQKRTFRFVLCFHRAGEVTTGIRTRYFYSRFFPDLESVAGFALANFAALQKRGAAFDRHFTRARLNPSRRFMLAQAIHSYYGSTQLLEEKGKPLWIVNEGEYRMLNTFDLTVDHLFFEMRLNPWTVANELDLFSQRYAYTDRVHFPGEKKSYPGGLSFTHDMGVANHFSRPGYSAYEKAGITGCFSQMSHEELVNWAVCALVYEHHTRDRAWLRRNLSRFRNVLTSLLNRDHPDPAQRDGVMSLDSSRCAGGAEITTYDSLDVSLGQARNNLYLAVKCWGVYVGLAALFARLGDKNRSEICEHQAQLAAGTISASADAKNLLPAILNENVTSRIIPAIEGLIIPYRLGLRKALAETGPYGELIRTLRKHLEQILTPGICLFDDGGWKISSTSNNSWLSKIYLCQFIAERILKGVTPQLQQRADDAHAAWLLNPANAYWAWSDQIVSGEAKGSKYYPRGVTSILWME